MTRPRNFWRSLDRISNMIELLIMCHVRGFDVLLGKAPVPTSLEIHEMMNAGRVRMPDDFKPSTRSNETEAERIVYDSEYFNEAVNLAGGWKHIYYVARAFKEVESRMWSVVVDHIRFVNKSSTRYMSKLGYVASRYEISPNTVMKYRREFPQKLAEAILMPATDNDEFYLLPG